MFNFFKTIIFCLLVTTAGAEIPKLVEYSPSIHRDGRDLLIYKQFTKSPENKKILTLFETLYNQNLLPVQSRHSIPKIVHQIWLGSPLPKKFQRIMKTWMGWKGWDYKLWTDAEASKMPMINRKLFDRLKNYGAKADVLRCEILYREGGLYVDIDFECLNSLFFDWASDQYDFYAGIETLRGCKKVNLCNALMGAKKGHPFMKQVIEELGHIEKAPALDDIIDTTGPGFITKQFLEYNSKPIDTVDIAFTPPYFYPLSKTDLTLNYKKIQKLIKLETAALHHWKGTWLKTYIPRGVYLEKED